MIIRAPRPEARFTQIRNDVLRDKRLSYRSRGILAYLLSLPDDWRTNSVEISRDGKEGREAVRTALKELEVFGYLIRDRVKVPQQHGYIWRSVVYVYDTPDAAAAAAADREARRQAPPAPAAAATSEEAASETGDGFPGARKPGAPTTRAPEKAASFKDCLPNTENEQENTARGDARIDGQPVPAASGRARESSPLVPSSSIADVTELGSLFEPADSAPNGAVAPPSSARPPLPNDAADCSEFMRFWNAGPKRGARKAAYAKWGKAYRDGVSVDLIEAGWVAHVAEWANWPEADRQFIPHASTWLQEERWSEPPERRYPVSLTPVPGGRRREDPAVQAEREMRELQAEWEAGEITPESLFPRQARLAREEAARRAARSA